MEERLPPKENQSEPPTRKRQRWFTSLAMRVLLQNLPKLALLTSPAGGAGCRSRPFEPSMPSTGRLLGEELVLQRAATRHWLPRVPLAVQVKG